LTYGKKKCCRIQRIRGRKRESKRYYRRFKNLKFFVSLCFVACVEFCWSCTLTVLFYWVHLLKTL
jgi:hypothetical protein